FLYVTGGYTGAVDFASGPGAAILSSPGTASEFMEKLDGQGGFVWATNLGGGASVGWVDSALNVFTAPHAPGFYPSSTVISEWTQTSVSGRVWLDANGDGIQGGNESGVAGVAVHLFDAVDGNAGNGNDVLLATQVTDANGAYQFTG